MILADSIRQTASIARWVSDAVTEADQSMVVRPCKAEGVGPYFSAAAFSLARPSSKSLPIILSMLKKRPISFEI